MKMINYDREQLEVRRRNCESSGEIKDVIVWSNDRMIKWVIEIGLKVNKTYNWP